MKQSHCDFESPRPPFLLLDLLWDGGKIQSRAVLVQSLRMFHWLAKAAKMEIAERTITASKVGTMWSCTRIMMRSIQRGAKSDQSITKTQIAARLKKTCSAAFEEFLRQPDRHPTVRTDETNAAQEAE